MNKAIKFVAAAAAMAAMTASADLYYATINTEGYTVDTNPSAENVGRYTGYLCTVEAANKLFGGSADIGDVRSYLFQNYWTGGKASLIAEAQKADSGVLAMTDNEFYYGQYSFSRYLAEGLKGDYIAVVTYAHDLYHGFRVFANTAADGAVVFDDASEMAGQGGTQEVWQFVPVPEPTSGVLLLLGSALLCLRRKQRRS